jgi:hypothetical protein
MCSINDSQCNGYVLSMFAAMFDATDWRDRKFSNSEKNRGFTGKNADYVMQTRVNRFPFSMWRLLFR